MLDDWAAAISDAVGERDRLRRDLDATRQALSVADTKWNASLKENEQLHEDKRLLQKMVIDTVRKLEEEKHEHRATLAINADLRRDLDHTQNLYRTATEEVYGMRLRIRFLEDIAHKTGHIIRLDGGGTK